MSGTQRRRAVRAVADEEAVTAATMFDLGRLTEVVERLETTVTRLETTTAEHGKQLALQNRIGAGVLGLMAGGMAVMGAAAHWAFERISGRLAIALGLQ